METSPIATNKDDLIAIIKGNYMTLSQDDLIKHINSMLPVSVYMDHVFQVNKDVKEVFDKCYRIKDNVKQWKSLN